MRASLVAGAVLGVVFSCGVVLATSAVRFEGESPRSAAERAFKEFSDREPEAASMRGASAYDQAKSVFDVDFSPAPLISDYRRLFLRLRDERFQEDPDKSGFFRRISWLYPHDGCFTRAAVAGKRADEMGWKRPANIFAFGALEIQTKNSVQGKESWWYHVAPLANDSTGKAWVLDPAIDPSGPLGVEDWLKRVGDIASVKVSLCSAYTWEPYRPCDESDTANQASLIKRQLSEYLPAERQNLITLQRDPNKELGDAPPWIGD